MSRSGDIPSPGEALAFSDPGGAGKVGKAGKAGKEPSSMPGDPPKPRPAPADISRPDMPEGPRTVFARLIMPADDWAREGASRGPRTLHLLIALSLVAIVVAAAAAVAGYRDLLSAASALNLILIALAVAALAALGSLRKIRRDLHEPLVALNRWALGMCSGDFSTRMAIPKSHPSTRGAVQTLAFHVNRLSEALEGLADNMDETVWRQTEGLREKNASLELLYEIAASVARHDSLDDALHDSAKALMRRAGASSARIVLRDREGALERVARIEPEACDFAPPSDGAGLDIDLDHQGRNFGVIRLSGEAFPLFEGRQGERLLAGVGNHLGMMVAKARTDEESKSLSIIRQRAAIAHELHDSLAQTIAGLRVQTNLLADSLAVDGSTPRELARIQSSLDDANADLRELIAGFRAPLRDRDLTHALEELGGRFRARSGMDIHLRIEGDLPALAPAAQLQVVRIIGEALANAGAHSQGRLARVLVRKEGRVLRVLIEDDGKGFTLPCTAGSDHIGLSIMQERAREIGGHLVIESELGEGTRVILEFPIPEGKSAEGES
ncbi:MAG: hypothetical protein ISN28_10440 [Ectothiorhodospiraceae bacterium AqS1]|nr:hypothetical protein [Ectothiorhodospiraceae bacterium AqS1]